MKRSFALALYLILGCPLPGHAQALLPYVEGGFFDNNGNPLAAGKICTTVSGSSVTNLATYPTAADAAAGTNANANPVVLDSSGRGNIWLAGGVAYRIVIYANGIGGTCNGSPVGTAIKTADGVTAFPINITALIINNIYYCNAYPGATAGAKMAACLAAIPSSGGVADARGIVGAQSIVQNVSIGANKTLLLGATTLTCNFAGIPFTLAGDGAQLIGESQSATELLVSNSCAPFSAVLITADETTLRDFTISTSVPSGQEASQLAAVTLSKSSQLTGVTISGMYISGANNAIMGDVLIPLGVNHLRVTNNKIRGLQYGIAVQTFPYGVVNADVVIENNDVEVSALGGYPGFWLARSIAIFNCNGCKILNNRAMGGFNGIETLGNIGNPSTGRPHEQAMIVSGNTIDSSPTVAQCDNCVFSNNTIDMSLRDPSWPPYTDPQVVANAGLRPAAELADNIGLSVTANLFSGGVGVGVDFGLDPHSTFTGNTVYNAGNSPNPNVYERSCLELTYVSTYVTISGNTFDTCKGAGINQTVRESFSGVAGVVVSNNIIRNTQTHGIHFHNVAAEGVVVHGNMVSAVNLTGGLFDAINFSLDGGTGAITGLTVTDNITTGGRYSILNSYVDSVANRHSYFAGNIGSSYTAGGAFNIHGRTINNWDGGWTTGGITPLTAGVLDLTSANDQLNLAGGSALSRIDNGTLGKVITIAFGALSTVTNSANIILNGGVGASVVTAGTMQFICLVDANNTNEVWYELDRGFYDNIVTTGNITMPAAKGLSWVGGATILQGSGAPAGACGSGSLYLRNDGGAMTSLYVCESAAWVGK